MHNSISVRIIVADSYKLIKLGLIKLLESLPNIFVIDEAEDGYELIAKCKRNPPDLVLVDSKLIDPEIFKTITDIHTANKNIKLLMVTSCEDDCICKNDLRKFCNGIINKNISLSELVFAIHNVMEGNFYLDHRTLQLPAVEIKSKPLKNKIDLLTQSENKVLYEMSKGLSKQGVSNELFLSIRTIESHCYKIKQKLGLDSTAQLIHFAHEVFQSNGNGKK